MARLTTKELFKYDWRVAIFLRKYEGKEKFEIAGGKKVEFVVNKAIISAVKSGDAATINKIGLLDTDGNQYAFGKIEKTAEFGGKGLGSGTAKEDIELQRLKDQIEKLKVELASSTVPIKIKSKVYHVAGAETTFGTPKSDFHLLDGDGKECVWISHKDGRTAKDFQQWGGMTEKGIVDHPEIQKFATDVYKMYDGIMPRATTVARKIKADKLKNLSVYGVDYGKPLGRQNVSILIQGPVNLAKSGNAYVFKSNHIHYNGEKITGDFEPVLMAMYKGDRSNFNVKGARFAIQPIKSRKINKMV